MYVRVDVVELILHWVNKEPVRCGNIPVLGVLNLVGLLALTFSGLIEVIMAMRHLYYNEPRKTYWPGACAGEGGRSLHMCIVGAVVVSIGKEFPVVR